MATEIVNAKISFVSLVDKAANKKSFAIIKSADKPTFQRQVPILKTDEAKKIVTGIVYEPDVLDAHDEFMTEGEIEKAAHLFMKEFRNVDKQHDFTSGYGEVIESWVAKSEMKLGDQEIKKGTWLMSVHVTDDDTWEGIQKGEITGFSMGGVGERVEHEDTEEVEKSESGLFKILKDFFSGNKAPIKKGEVKDKFEASIKRSNFWTAFDTLQTTLGYWDWRSDKFIMENDAQKIQEALQDFNEIITGILVSDDIIKALGTPDKDLITKAGKKISANNMTQIKTAYEALGKLVELDAQEEEEIDVKKEDIEKMIGEAVQKAVEPITKKLDDIEKGAEGTDGEEGTETTEGQDNIADVVSEAVAKALKPLNERLDKVEKARGIKKSEEDPEPTDPIKKSVWDGLL
jgi:hypothetical protein